jgi:hypothetical protein
MRESKMEILIMITTVRKIKTNSTVLRRSLIALSLMGPMVVAAPVTAASVCKGLESSACSKSSSCAWVEGYQRKDGRSVKSFCRTNSAAKSSAAKTKLMKNTTSKKVISKSDAKPGN